MLNKSVNFAAFIVLGFLMTPAQAQNRLPYAPSAAELAMLPEYCQARLGTNADLKAVWNQRMGPDKFVHVHHYCQGLNYMNRAKLNFNEKLRREYLQTAVGEFDYVLRNWPADFVLSIDAQKRKTLAGIMLGQP